MDDKIKKSFDKINEKILHFNELTKIISKYSAIFISFVLYYKMNEDGKTLHIVAFESDDITPETKILDNMLEENIKIDLEDEDEVEWVTKTIETFIKGSEETIAKAVKLSKPELGLMSYDEITDTYYLNRTSGNILSSQKTKLKILYKYRFMIFRKFIKIRNKYSIPLKDIEVLSTNKVPATSSLKERAEIFSGLIEKVNELGDKIKKYEKIPAWYIRWLPGDEIFSLEFYVSDEFDLKNASPENSVNRFWEKYDLNVIESCNKLRSVLDLVLDSNILLWGMIEDLEKISDPNFFESIDGMDYKIWTIVGKKIIDGIDMMGLLNKNFKNIELYSEEIKKGSY